MSTARFVCVIAGAQSGKTEFGPHWLHREIETCGPGDYLAVTATYDLFKLKMLPALLRLFCTHLKWGVFQRGDAVITSHDGRSRIILRSASSPGGLESGTCKAAWLDECGQDEFLVDSWQAVQRRLGIHQGRVLMTTTPYQGVTGWLYHDVYKRGIGGDRDYDIIQFASIENPAFSRVEYDRAKSVLPRWKFELFYNGNFARPAGLIYSDYDEIRHCIRPFSIPKEWPRHVGIDFGGTEHTALVWLAQDPATDRYYAYREAIGGGYTGAEHARMALEYREPVMRWSGGSGSEDGSRDIWRRSGVSVIEPPMGEVEAGIDRVIGLFKQDRLFVLDHMIGLRGELATYSREVDGMGEPTAKIADKERAHRLDALRYICSWIPLRPVLVSLTDEEREHRALEEQARRTIEVRRKMLRKSGRIVDARLQPLYAERGARSDGWGQPA